VCLRIHCGGLRAAAAAVGVVVEEVGGKAGAENLLLIGNRTRERECAACAHVRKDFTHQASSNWLGYKPTIRTPETLVSSFEYRIIGGYMLHQMKHMKHILLYIVVIGK
jgi:hypothetical protein